MAKTSSHAVKNTQEFGALLRKARKEQSLTLERTAGLTNLSIRFVSELERGKETAELGKALYLLNQLGLELQIVPKEGHSDE